MSCPGRNVRERLDPVINPGVVSGHVHTISGGGGFSASMTYQDARAAKCSSCQIKEDMSNYWTPQLYVKFKNGTFFPVPVMGDGDDTNGGMTVYYLQRRGDNQTEHLQAFPEGFRMIAGDTSARSYDGSLAAQGISFNCLGANKPETNGIPNYNCPDGMRAQLFFPQCWDGKNLDSANHKSHVSYPAGTVYNGGNCPPEYPIHLISIFFEILYDTNPYLDQWNGDQHPFVFANGDATGYGYHGDFFNGWDVPVLQNAIDTCTDDSGQVEKCAAVTMYTPQECNNCKLPTTVNETVDGLLNALPGCNPVTYGPARSPPATCPGSTPPALGFGSTNYVDVTQTKGWEYLGCGSDAVGDRAWDGAWTYTANMTVENCIDYCTAGGFSYAAPEYGNECFCSHEMNARYAPQEGIMGACTMKCVGNSNEICGAADAMSIYHKCEGGSCTNNEIGGKAPVQSVPTAPSPVPRRLRRGRRA
ncbi:WSC-domain-containing protein [Clathrospora elynae]|uniref:WSC-domain-containing protein n=1 Tax=Clathrospora elynae TaxID=706981 RepID=A0A6A5ST52_9PLEO|nr:WSC-domain-containing protein [Clathrospora elynae]